MFSSLISLWAYHLSLVPSSDSAKDVLETLRPGLSGARVWFRPVNHAGFGIISWFEGDFAASREDPRSLGRAISRADRPKPPWTRFGSFPTIRSRRYTRTSHSLVSCVATRPAQRRKWNGASSSRPSSIFRRGRGARRTACGYVRGCSPSAAISIAPSRWWRTSSGSLTRHGFDNWTMIADRRSRRPSRPLEPNSSTCPKRTPRQSSRPQHSRDSSGSGKHSSCRVFPPYDLTMTGAALVAAGDEKSAQTRSRTQSRSASARACASTRRGKPASRVARGRWIGHRRRAPIRARTARVRQGVRPFELRIALDLHDLHGAGSPAARRRRAPWIFADDDIRRCHRRSRAACSRRVRPPKKRKVAILGGGMAGMAAAWPAAVSPVGRTSSSRSPCTSAAGGSGARARASRRTRPHRGTRPPPLARVLRERLPPVTALL